LGLVVLKLVVAHFVAWGRIQRRDWLPGAEFSFWRALGGAGVYAAIALVLILLGDRPGGWGMVVWLVGTTAGVRLVLDSIRGRYLTRSWSNLIALQGAEVALICALTALAFDSGTFARAVATGLDSPVAYGVVATYGASVWLGGALVRLVTGLLGETKEQRPGIDGAGSIIGVLERLLVTSFVLFWPAYGAAAIGLIFSAKSIARFPEMGKENGTQFAEYYLVGTLTSFAVAIGAGMLARAYLL
jgi:hypothetical protein